MMEKLLNQMNKKSIAENITFIKNYIITINNSNLVLVYRLFIKEWITLQLKLSPMLFFNKIQEIFKLVIPGEDLFVSVFLDSKAHSSKDVGFRPNLIWLFKVHWQRFLVLLIVIRDYRRRRLWGRGLWCPVMTRGNILCIAFGLPQFGVSPQDDELIHFVIYCVNNNDYKCSSFLNFWQIVYKNFKLPN